ncbi:hypothetical protein ACQPXT_13520 [Streptomyces sp. CA-100214]
MRRAAVRVARRATVASAFAVRSCSFAWASFSSQRTDLRAAALTVGVTRRFAARSALLNALLASAAVARALWTRRVAASTALTARASALRAAMVSASAATRRVISFAAFAVVVLISGFLLVVLTN